MTINFILQVGQLYKHNFLCNLCGIDKKALVMTFSRILSFYFFYNFAQLASKEIKTFYHIVLPAEISVEKNLTGNQSPSGYFVQIPAPYLTK